MNSLDNTEKAVLFLIALLFALPVATIALYCFFTLWKIAIEMGRELIKEVFNFFGYYREVRKDGR